GIASGFLIMARAFGFICRASLASMCLLSTLFGQAAKHPSESASGLLEQFESTTVFWEQFLVAKKIVALHDTSVLPHLEPWLRCEDMRRRGNAAFIFARLGDGRGFQVIKAILEDRSTMRAAFAMDSAGHPSPQKDIPADRYSAPHLFRVLGARRAVTIQTP